MMLLMGAGVQEMVALHPGMAGNNRSNSIVSAENMTFYYRHKDAWLQHQRKIREEMFRQNGGRMPECVRGDE
jgi:hypothetical protein